MSVQQATWFGGAARPANGEAVEITLGSGSQTGTRFNPIHHLPQLFISCGTISGMVNEAVTNRMECNHGIDIVRSVVSQSINVVAFQIGAAIPSIEWGLLTAAFAKTASAVEHMSGNSSRSLVGVPHTRSDIRIRVPSVERPLADNFRVDISRCVDLMLKLVLLKSVSARQDENNVGPLPAFEIHLDFEMAIINPLAIETDPILVADEQEKRPAVEHVVTQFYVVVAEPRVVVSLGRLAIVLICSVRKISIIVASLVRIRNSYDGLFELAVFNSLLSVAAEDLFHLGSRFKDVTNVILPGHCHSTSLCPAVVAERPFVRVNGRASGGRE